MKLDRHWRGRDPVGTSALGSIALGAGDNARPASWRSAPIQKPAPTWAPPPTNPGFGTLAGATASGEVSVSGDTERRRITNPAAGSAPTDAVNVSQLEAATEWSIRYTTLAKDVATLEEPRPAPRSPILAAGDVDATSTDAVNSSQLYALSDSIATHLGGTATLNTDGTITGPTLSDRSRKLHDWSSTPSRQSTPASTTSTATSARLLDRAVRYDGAEGDAKDTITLEGATGTTITNPPPRPPLGAASTDAVNGSRLCCARATSCSPGSTTAPSSMTWTQTATGPTLITLIGGDPNAPVLVKNIARRASTTPTRST